MVRDAKLRGRDAVDFDREGRIVGVLRRESMRPSDAVESLLPLEPLAEYWEQSLSSQSSQSERSLLTSADWHYSTGHA